MIGVRKSAVALVDGLLAEQHVALLAGDLDGLSRMSPALEKALIRLRRDGAAAGDIARLQSRAARNARLLQAARTGLSQARQHLERGTGAELTTYGADGRSRSGLMAPTRTLARR